MTCDPIRPAVPRKPHTNHNVLPEHSQSEENHQSKSDDGHENTEDPNSMKSFMTFVRESFKNLNEKVDNISTSQAALEKKLDVVKVKADANENLLVDLKDSVEFNGETIKKCEEAQASLVAENAGLKTQLKQTSDRLDALQNQVLRNERHSRAFNIRVLGVGEVELEEGVQEDCISVVQTMLSDQFNITGNVIETAHRTGKRSEGQPRHIIARFYSRPVCQRVMRQARAALEGTDRRLVDDLCAADAAEKRRLKPLIENLYANGKRPSFRNGQLFVAGKPFRNTEIALAGLHNRR